jgi:hypothetical protein
MWSCISVYFQKNHAQFLRKLTYVNKTTVWLHLWNKENQYGNLEQNLKLFCCYFSISSLTITCCWSLHYGTIIECGETLTGTPYY